MYRKHFWGGLALPLLLLRWPYGQPPSRQMLLLLLGGLPHQDKEVLLLHLLLPGIEIGRLKAANFTDFTRRSRHQEGFGGANPPKNSAEVWGGRQSPHHPRKWEESHAESHAAGEG